MEAAARLHVSTRFLKAPRNMSLHLVCLFLLSAATSSVFSKKPSMCLEQMQYHEEYREYGFDIVCTDLDGNVPVGLQHLAGPYRETRVIVLRSNLSDLSLFGNMTRLKEIVISDTGIRSFAGLRRLDQLQTLTISDCDVGTKIPGLLFDALSDLRSCNITHARLTELRLGSNNLTSIRRLDLSRNAIADWDSVDFCGMDNLERLKLSDNLLTAVPSSANCFTKHLIYFSLDFNRLERFQLTVPASLEHLDLSNNRLRHIEPDIFRDAIALKTLKLEDNFLETIDPLVLTGALNLEELNLRSNRIREISENFGLTESLKQLRRLFLDANQLTRLSLNSFRELKVLSLSSNSLDLKQVSLVNLTSLETLDASKCGLKCLTSESLRIFGKLTNLDLSDNSLQLSCLNFWNDSVTSLKKLSFRNNSISTLDPNVLSTVADLQHLDLSQNRLRELRLLPVLRSLTVLNVSGNQLNVLNREVLLRQRNLETLDLRDNRLNALDYKELADNLTGLRLINVVGNRFPCPLLADMIAYFNKSKIDYAPDDELVFSGQNVGGLACHEYADHSGSKDHESYVSEPATSSRGPNISMWVLGISIGLLHVIIFVLAYNVYSFMKRRRELTDEFQLLTPEA